MKKKEKEKEKEKKALNLFVLATNFHTLACHYNQ
jgi:hypothetical protein